ncbi:MAG: hypothetical protein ACOYOV_06300 [Bacteroidales bacterium]
MLFDTETTKKIIQTSVKQNTALKKKTVQPETFIENESLTPAFVSDRDVIVTKAIGNIQPGQNIHYYSYGNFNLIRLILYILKQTGPANVFLSSYSFSSKSITQIINLLAKKQLLSFKVLLDNRVKSISPKPFQIIATSLDYRCTSIHAKTALVWNDTWNLTIVTSQNATDNPKIERGIIFTDKEVFNFDFKILHEEFYRNNKN